MDNSEPEKTRHVAALGRPFGLGMLYDCRSETLLTSLNLWDKAMLEEKHVQELERSNFQVLCSDSLEKKTAALAVDGSLKLSFLAGLLKCEGAAQYLNDSREFSHQERLELFYRCTTRVESLTMAHLGEGKVQYPEVIDSGIATHVVSSIIYGAEAVLIFERNVNHSSSYVKKEGKGSVGAGGREDLLTGIAKKVSGMKMNGDGKLDLSDIEKKEMEQFVCRFYGDIMLHKNPSSLQDAVKLYEEFPTLLGENGKKAVPVMVDLHPLSLINTTVIKLIKTIRMSLINETEMFFNQMDEFIIKCKDILKSDASLKFFPIRSRMKLIMQLIEKYRREIQENLCGLLPRIRGGEDENLLAELLNKINQSPFRSSALDKVLETMETQTAVLSSYIEVLGDIKFVTKESDLVSVSKGPNTTHCLCLTFWLPIYDSQLKAMECHPHKMEATNTSINKDVAGAKETNSKFSIMEVARVFKNFHNSNRATEGVFFLVAQEYSECKELYASIRYYKYGKLINSDYELPSAPEGLNVISSETTHNSITITWNPPHYGASAITSYVINYCPSVTEPVDKSLTVACESHSAIIPCLAANTEYMLVIKGVCEAGNSPFGEAVVRTNPTSPPEILPILKASRTKVLLSWLAPAYVATGCCIERYIIKQETGAGGWEETMSIPSVKLSCIIEVIPNTVHKYRVAAFCGLWGCSRDSEPVTVDFTQPTDHMRCRSCGAEISENTQGNFLNISSPISDFSQQQNILRGTNFLVQTFTNPCGEAFKVLTLRGSVCTAEGEWTAFHSWFPGYLWKVGRCPRCKTQLGWVFSSGRRAISPCFKSASEGFYGLILDKLKFIA